MPERLVSYQRAPMASAGPPAPLTSLTRSMPSGAGARKCSRAPSGRRRVRRVGMRPATRLFRAAAAETRPSVGSSSKPLPTLSRGLTSTMLAGGVLAEPPALTAGREIGLALDGVVVAGAGGVGTARDALRATA